VFAHLRSIGLLLALTIGVCSVAYPLSVLAVGQTVFPTKASGSIVTEPGSKAIGSRLIAQEFKDDEWFQSRPSAAGYNAAASGGSNLGANNPKLRDRVARQLGPVVRYAGGPQADQPVGPDIDRWFAARPDRAAVWARRFPTLAAAWVKDNAEAVSAWEKAHPSVDTAPSVSDVPGRFFEHYVRAHPGTWPAVVEKVIQPASAGPDIRAVFFEMWLQEHGTDDLQPVPADAVTASGSGLDPHITLRNARGQLDRVVTAWAAKTKTEPAKVRGVIEAVLTNAAFEPLAGVAGDEPLVNVFEVNLALARQFSQQ
jgi:K+-transporting ATPase ATPase C chain